MVPPELSLYLGGLTDKLAALLGDRLVGVYVGGSVALDAYEHGRSDVDVAAVAVSSVARAEKEAIVAAVRHEAFPCPARGLELVLYSRAVAGSGMVEAGFELNLNTGPRMEFRLDLEPDPSESHWFAIDRSILAERGLALAGPPAAGVFAVISRAALLPIVTQSLEWHMGGTARGDDAVLNAARALHFAHRGSWASKPEAGRWAAAEGIGAVIVRRALEARSSGLELPPDEAAAFVRRVRDRIEEQRGN